MNIIPALLSTSDDLTLGIAFIAAIVCALAATIAACACLNYPSFVYSRKRKHITFLDILLFLLLFIPPGLFCILLVIFTSGQPAAESAILFNTWIAPLPPYLFGALVCAFAAALPWQWLAARLSYRRLSTRALESAALLGISRRGIWRVIVKAAAGRRMRRGIIVTFAAALGEYTATYMLLSEQTGRVLQNIISADAKDPLAVYLVQFIQSGRCIDIFLVKVILIVSGAAVSGMIGLLQRGRNKGHTQ